MVVYVSFRISGKTNSSRDETRRGELQSASLSLSTASAWPDMYLPPLQLNPSPRCVAVVQIFWHMQHIRTSFPLSFSPPSPTQGGSRTLDLDLGFLVSLCSPSLPFSSNNHPYSDNDLPHPIYPFSYIFPFNGSKTRRSSPVLGSPSSSEVCAHSTSSLSPFGPGTLEFNEAETPTPLSTGFPATTTSYSYTSSFSTSSSSFSLSCDER